MATKTQTNAVVPTNERDALLKEMDALIARTNKEKPDPKAMQELRASMKKHPELWRGLYDLGAQTTQAIIEMVQGTGLVLEVIRRDTTALRDEMGYPTATPLERGLIEAVVQAWLVQQTTQHLYARNMKGSLTLKQADYWERKLTMTQRRYLRACETLARVRRLLTPAVQLNIARKQVNIAGAQVNVPVPADRAPDDVIDGTAQE